LQDVPKFEIALDYTYARFIPSHDYIPNSYSLNGGGAAFDFNFTKYLGVKADFQGYGSNTQAYSIPFDSTLCLALGLFPTPAPCTGRVQANLFTYLFGPQIGIRTGKLRPYGHLLIGVAHSDFPANLFSTEAFRTYTPSNNAFALAVGGGLDIPINHSGTIAVRPAEVDYLWTRFNLQTSGLTGSLGNNSQSNFQYKAGVIFNF
jgi:opacity protein-like surface antigen